MLAFIMPVAFYTKLFWKQISKPWLVVNFLILILGLSAGIYSFVGSLIDLIDSYKS